jgi:hypothetical protein
VRLVLDAVVVDEIWVAELINWRAQKLTEGRGSR